MPNPAEGTGLFCHRDQSRPCGPECMAYLPQVPEGAMYTGAQWAHCMLLVQSERISRHLVIIADIMKQQRAAAIRTQTAPGVI